jgi:hypothetical protein
VGALRTLVVVCTQPRGVALGLAASALAALAIAIPTAVLPNPMFTRMTPVRPLDLVLLTVTAILAGVIGATYATRVVATPACERRAGSGGLLAFLAIGCPVCNKVVVALLGTSGAFAYFEPIQPVLGVAGILLLLAALGVRLRAIGIHGPALRSLAA